MKYWFLPILLELLAEGFRFSVGEAGRPNVLHLCSH